jgi:hypothetical protein
MGNLQRTAKFVGWLWFFLAMATLANAALLFRIDLRASQEQDPTGFALTFGIINVLASLLFLLCGVALVRSWRGTLWWLALPAALLVLFGRMLWEFRGGFAA